MAFEITTIRKIINETEEPVSVYNREKGTAVHLGARETIECALDIPWMMSAGDFTNVRPHLLQVHFDFTGDYIYFWQRDQYIIRGTNLANGIAAPDFWAVKGARDMIIARHGAFLFNFGKAPKRLYSGPAIMVEEDVSWAKGEPRKD